MEEDELYMEVYGHAKNKRNLKSIPTGDRKNFGRKAGAAGITSNDAINPDDSTRKQKRQISLSSCIGRLCQPCGNIRSKRYQKQG